MKKYLLSILLLGCAFAGSAQTSQELLSYLPKVEGWTLADNMAVFNAENLYDRINGGADAFLICHFVEMTALDYTKNNSETYISMQMYRHASPADAFCAYSGERSPRSEFLNIGTEAYREPSMLYFLSGSVYVKIQTHDKSPETAHVMETIARTLAAEIDINPAFPALLNAFPKASKAPYSEVYIVESFLGHRFLHNAYRATYKQDGKEYSLFIMDGSNTEGAEKMLKDYFAFTKQPVVPKENEQYTITDRYNGDIVLRWKGRYLLGLINDDGAEIDAADLLQQVEANAVK